VADRYDLRLPALRLRQGERHIYLFGVDGKKLHEFTAVSRVHRDETETLHGYQRPEVLAHIRAIRRYLESPGAMLPNALVVAFDDRVRFVPTRSRTTLGPTETGVLVIPIDEADPEVDRPAWLVDGQQRSAAIRDADLPEFPVAAVGFIATTEEDQRSQFILVNNTKPLPKGLIHELLPDTDGQLPVRYARRRLPAQIMIRLNTDADSPFRGLIATPTAPTGYVKDNSILKMIENSLYEGCLYQYRDPRTGSGDAESMLVHLKIFWTSVRLTWPEAWALPPRQSRLTHGVGIQALGFVMDSLTEGSSPKQLAKQRLTRVLAQLGDVTAWTTGGWELAPGDTRRWNGLQNTPTDVRLLTNLLLQRLQTTTR
jgi:DGQHR domain-containing protein